MVVGTNRWILLVVGIVVLVAEPFSVNAQSQKKPVVDADASIQKNQLRILSYNIHHGQGTDGLFDYQRLAKVIKSAQPDLVALQEVDRKTKRVAGVDQAAKLGELTGMYHSFAEAMPYQGGSYGKAVLSRFPLLKSETKKLPNMDKLEPRAIALIEVAPWGDAGPKVTFGSTHLSNESGKLRVKQMQEINRLFGTTEQRILISGDFNFRSGSDPYQEMKKQWNDSAAEFGDPQPTSPAGKPRSRIDYVFTLQSQQWKVVDVQVIEAPIESDHRPLLVVLQLVE